MGVSADLPSYFAGNQKLNALKGSEWLAFTKTWFIHNPVQRGEKVVHPATLPESLAADFISFFTKPGDWVLDPFLGTGSVLVAAKDNQRHGVGIELYPYFASFAEKRLSTLRGDVSSLVLQGDSREVLARIKAMKLPPFSLCLTSPPYWSQLGMSTERTRDRKDKNLKTVYGKDRRDFGNIQDYNLFLEEQTQLFSQVYDLTKRGGHLVVITNNVYKRGRLYPLAFDTFKQLGEKWVPKDEKIWCQDNKELIPFGMWTAWVGNRSHHYCLIFRKEK